MIKMTKNYYLDADDKQIMLKEKSIIKDEKSKNYGEKSFNVLGYFRTVDSAILYLRKHLNNRMIKENDMLFDEYLEKLKELNLKIIDILNCKLNLDKEENLKKVVKK